MTTLKLKKLEKYDLKDRVQELEETITKDESKINTVKKENNKSRKKIYCDICDMNNGYVKECYIGHFDINNEYNGNTEYEDLRSLLVKPNKLNKPNNNNNNNNNYKNAYFINSNNNKNNNEKNITYEIINNNNIKSINNIKEVKNNNKSIWYRNIKI
ncbi:hypothetical protein PIROE2DRAFT_6466 [Piromyces sp. E2]|nr:hypothetical protein PIROE2DRAFT_6466 [Piromyces sp. E2]|eukprot:OUM66330.1 hypothetical protein PIROE2DRAFT_6466 [Piromyces sp. E2]